FSGTKKLRCNSAWRHWIAFDSSSVSGPKNGLGARVWSAVRRFTAVRRLSKPSSVVVVAGGTRVATTFVGSWKPARIPDLRTRFLNRYRPIMRKTHGGRNG